MSPIKLASVLGVSRRRVRMATLVECVRVFGYRPGCFGPIGHREKFPVYISDKLSRPGELCLGAGSETAMIKMSFAELARCTNGTVCTLSEEVKPMPTGDAIVHGMRWRTPGAAEAAATAASAAASSAVSSAQPPVPPGSAPVSLDGSGDAAVEGSAVGSDGNPRFLVDAEMGKLVHIIRTKDDGSLPVPSRVLPAAEPDDTALLQSLLQLHRQPRFLVDNMMGRLVRWLRVVGCDTEFLADRNHDELMKRAADEGRIVLTRDRTVMPCARVKELLERAAELCPGLRVAVRGEEGLWRVLLPPHGRHASAVLAGVWAVGCDAPSPRLRGPCAAEWASDVVRAGGGAGGHR